MSSAETLTVTNITLPETELPKVKMININNVMYRCEREDENKKGPSQEEIESMIKKALSNMASPTQSRVIVNFTTTEQECPEAKRLREEKEAQERDILQRQSPEAPAQVPILRADSSQSLIESLTEVREIEEPTFSTHSTKSDVPIQNLNTAYQPVNYNTIYKTYVQGGEPNYERPSASDSNRVNQILNDLLNSQGGDTEPVRRPPVSPVRPAGEPRFVLTKVTKFITKRVHQEKTCSCP